MTENEYAAQLLKRRDDVESLVSENKIVDDVLDGRAAVISRTSRKAGQSAPGIAIASPIGVNAEPAPVTGMPYPGGERESRYIPKHELETAAEYERRLAMTPFFPETPGILQSRQGAIFRKPPDVHLPPELFALQSQAACGGQSLLDVIVKVSELCQTGGFAGICVDREYLPDDLDPDTLSLADVQTRGLGRVILAPYAAHQIRDWKMDGRGLRWVKVVEMHDGDSEWNEDPREHWAVRIIDRSKINLYTVKKKHSGNYKIEGPKEIPHGATDSIGRPIVPFRMFNPFPARDGIGRSNLRLSADADVAAVRVLSDLLWMLHMMAPILTLTTTRELNELDDIGLGSSYLNILQGKRGDKDAEILKFCQLDPSACDKLAAMYDRLRQAAREQANKSADVGVAGPVEQSGISKAWTFKTGEERVLFLLSVCLQEGFQWIFELAARMSGADPSQASIRFAPNYDVTGVPEQIAIVSEAEPLLARYKLKTALSHTFKQVTRHLMGNAPDTELAQSDKECDEISKHAAIPAGEPAIKTTMRVPLTEGDGVE